MTTSEVDVPERACCITGMHRSGTSMVARLLNECGMFLGSPDELTRPAPDNLGGYFENSEFVTLNEDLMRQFDGTWDKPPRFPEGWEFSSHAAKMVTRGEKLVAKSRQAYWGWKDPRTSITLPFWRRLVPDLRVVICLRNPIEVDESLFLRGDDSFYPSSFELWTSHYQRLLAAIPPQQRLVTHYQSYFEAPRAELKRLLTWLEMPVSDEAIKRAAEFVSNNIRHQKASQAELLSRAPDETLALYFSLCAEAGPIYQAARAAAEAADFSNTPVELTNRVAALKNELRRVRAFNQEVLDSRAFRLASIWWRLRRRQRAADVDAGFRVGSPMGVSEA
jgi:hypothetical protein